MTAKNDLILTAAAPVIWGSSYLVITEYLPDNYPITIAMLRALPVGLLLLLAIRRLPTGHWWLKITLLGALNFSFFWWMLFIAAYRLPGGVAATIGAVQPLIVIGLSRAILGSPVRLLAVKAALLGMAGIALLLLTPQLELDLIGAAAGFAGAASMAYGTVLSRHWRPPVSALTFTCWQLIAGGLLLLPPALLLEPPLPPLTMHNLLALSYLGLIGAGLTYVLWFRGISKLDPARVSALGFLSPVSAVALGWLLLDQRLSGLQILAVIIVFFSVCLSQLTTDKKSQKPEAIQSQ